PRARSLGRACHRSSRILALCAVLRRAARAARGHAGDRSPGARRSPHARRRRPRSPRIAARAARRFAAQPRGAVREAHAGAGARAPRARIDAAPARTIVIIRGTTRLIAHIGHPTHAFKAPMIYNPYFEHAGIDAVVVPMGCESAPYSEFLRAVFRLTNILGALITMPHKVTTLELLDEATPAVRIAGACNAVRKSRDGRLQGDLFDGE